MTTKPSNPIPSGRLLSAEEIKGICDKFGLWEGEEFEGYALHTPEAIAQAQDIKSTALDKAEIAELKGEIMKLCNQWADSNNGKTAIDCLLEVQEYIEPTIEKVK